MIRRLVVVMLIVSGSVNAADSSVADLLGSAKTYLEQNEYLLALSDLDTAQGAHPTPAQQAVINGLIGLTRFQMRQYPDAEKRLQLAIHAQLGEQSDQVRWRLALGEIQADRGHTEAARRLLQEAQKLAAQNLELKLASQLSLIALLPQSKKLTALQAIYQQMPAINNPNARARVALNLAQQARTLGDPALQLSFEALEGARKLAGNDQPRLLAESLDGLAQLYEEEQRYNEAGRLNKRALDLAWRMEAHDLLINLEWRQARLYRQQRENDDAIAAYRQAIEQIETIRQDIPVEYHEGRSSFRETLEPVYLGLADLLLAKASRETGEKRTQLLHNARDAIELIKRSELEDFLGGRCAVQIRNTQLDQVESSTAVLYPVILPDRLELIVSTNSGIRHFTQPVEAKQVQEAINQYAAALRELRNNRAAAKTLYDWLIAPAQDWLNSHGVKTLVFVPDGVLRKIPPSALYDGQHYLIEKYALVTSPGLSLFDPQPIKQHALKALLAGLSEPGDVVDHLPEALWKSIIKSKDRGVTGNLRETPLTEKLEPPPAGQPLTTLAKHDPSIRKSVQERLKLPGVEAELSQLNQTLSNTTLLNRDFTKDNFKQQLLKQPYSVVHIASHGIFGPSAQSSFILAYDDIIDMNEIETLLKGENFAKNPVELLSLSACETAEGDDRAPLGISGIALKAKVRSALGTLWPVSDEAAAKLMTAFYQNLRTPGINKAEALRQAQIELIREKDLSNPFFWSPFILVGNWL